MFPRLVGEGLYGYVSRRLLARHRDARALPRGHLRHPRGRRSPAACSSAWATATCASRTASRMPGRIIPSALVESGCRIGEGARIGGRVVLEHGVTVGENTTIERAVVMQGTEIGSHCTLSGCIIAGGVRIGDDCHVDGMSVLGEGVTIGAGNVVSNGARLFPGVDAARRRAALLMDPALDAAARRRGRLDRPGRRHRSTSPTTCATRCGASTRRRSRPSTRPAGMIVAGMGGSAVGGRLALRRDRAAAAAPAGDRRRLRAAGLGRAGHARAVLELLGHDRGDAGRLRRRGRARRAADGGHHRRAARSSARGATACR